MKRLDRIYQKIEIELNAKKSIRALAFNNEVTERNLITAICEATLSNEEMLAAVLKRLGVANPKLPKKGETT